MNSLRPPPRRRWQNLHLWKATQGRYILEHTWGFGVKNVGLCGNPITASSFNLKPYRHLFLIVLQRILLDPQSSVALKVATYKPSYLVTKLHQNLMSYRSRRPAEILFAHAYVLVGWAQAATLEGHPGSFAASSQVHHDAQLPSASQ